MLLKKYKIVSEIARGGMAVVYRARHVHYDEEMALKILNEADQHAFVAEARVLRRLRHPHIVQVEDADFLEDGRPFLAMEFIDGEDLATRLRRTGPMQLEEALRLVAEACSGLAAAHDAGMIHRDIKPKNLLIASSKDRVETVKLIDFGIAKVRRETGIGFTGVQQDTTGFFLGTPQYASPEQVLLSPLDGRTDIYSMGLVLYEMLTGRPPSGEDSDEAILENQRPRYPTPPRRIMPDVPLLVSHVVMRALERDRTARYQTAREMQNACESVRAALIGEETRRTRAAGTPDAGESKPRGKAAHGRDHTLPSVAGPSGTAGQARIPVAWKMRSRTVLVFALAVTAVLTWRLVTEPGRPSPGRTSDQTTAPRVGSGKPTVPGGEHRKVGAKASHQRGKTGTNVNAGVESAKESISEEPERRESEQPLHAVSQVSAESRQEILRTVQVWNSSILSGNIGLYKGCYASRLTRFYGHANVPIDEAVQMLIAEVQKYPIRELVVSNPTFHQVVDGGIQLDYDKEYRFSGSRVRLNQGKVRASLRFTRVDDGTWKIAAEFDREICWSTLMRNPFMQSPPGTCR